MEAKKTEEETGVTKVVDKLMPILKKLNLQDC